ncbi:uncharacterized protein LOC117608786 isoform X1 [Osmia lignaria lignaria]|uniref:uncharacterized protein LOC117608786 isoform X1 n=1 Tax=Osmia lignaria lignaria TaxID=1437193 RepID=UPI001478D6FE|nr:uncharacterized protein LOC117608786 isoform X1 [Osmia lignaria]
MRVLLKCSPTHSTSYKSYYEVRTPYLPPFIPPSVIENISKRSKRCKLPDTSPLSHELFDHETQAMRLAADGKSPIWYCLQVMNYYQFEKEPKPRFTYSRDVDTDLITASVRLSSGNIFIGDPCEDYEKALGSAAKKAYEEDEELSSFYRKHFESTLSTTFRS